MVITRLVYGMLFTQFTVDQSKLTVNGSVLSDTPNVRYLVALYLFSKFLHFEEIVSAKMAVCFEMIVSET